MRPFPPKKKNGEIAISTFTYKSIAFRKVMSYIIVTAIFVHFLSIFYAVNELCKKKTAI